MSEQLTQLEESSMQNTIKLTIENKHLKAEIKKLKEALNKISQVQVESIEPNYLCDNCEIWTSGLLKALEETEILALSSLKSKEEEE